MARRFLGVYSWIGGPIVDFGGLDKHARKGLMILYPKTIAGECGQCESERGDTSDDE